MTRALLSIGTMAKSKLSSVLRGGRLASARCRTMRRDALGNFQFGERGEEARGPSIEPFSCATPGLLRVGVMP
jgi:hypothetical protein